MSNRDVRPIQVGLRLLALIVALGIQPSSLSATTIVLVRSRSELFVGADSKRVRDGTQDVRIDTGCKITRDNHGAVAAARVTAESSWVLTSMRCRKGIDSVSAPARSSLGLYRDCQSPDRRGR